MYQTFAVYFLLLLLMLLSFHKVYRLSPYRFNGYKHAKTGSYYFVLLFPLLIYSFVMGIRYDVGVDHLEYLNNYLYGFKYEQREILFSIINNSFALCHISYPLFFGFLSFIQISLSCLAFRKEPWLLVWLVIFWLLYGEFQSWNNIIRASISTCLFTFSLDYLAQKKIIPLILFSLIILGFHTSGIIVALIYVLFYRGENLFKSTFLQYTLLFSSLLLRSLFYRFGGILDSSISIYYDLTGSYEHYSLDYALNNTSELGTGLGFIFILFVNILIISYSNKLHAFYNTSKFNIIYNLFFVGIIVNYIIPGELIVFHRPFLFFKAMSPIVFAYFAYYLYLQRNRKELNKLILSVLLVAFVGMYVGNIALANKNSHLWYQTCWDNPKVPLTPRYEPHSIFKN